MSKKADRQKLSVYRNFQLKNNKIRGASEKFNYHPRHLTSPRAIHHMTRVYPSPEIVPLKAFIIGGQHFLQDYQLLPIWLFIQLGRNWPNPSPPRHL